MMLKKLLLVIFGFVIGAYAQTEQSILPSPRISIPVLVEEKAGQVAYGLSADNFSIKDDGVEQKVILDADPRSSPIFLALAIQTGNNTSAQLNKISGLGDLLDSVLTNPSDRIAVTTFGRVPHQILDFAVNTDNISSIFSSLTATHNNAAMFDALHNAIRLFQKTPRGSRRIIILISGNHDHGSIDSDTASLIHDVSRSNISIYSLSFSTSRKDLLNKLRSLNPLTITAGSMQKNAPETLAQLTGGDAYHFGSQKEFEQHFLEIADHIHNRYNLSFHPSNPLPGFHTITVRVKNIKANVIAARSGYWCSSLPNPTSGGGSQ